MSKRIKYEDYLERYGKYSDSVAQGLGFEGWDDIRNKIRFSNKKEDKEIWNTFIGRVNTALEDDVESGKSGEFKLFIK